MGERLREALGEDELGTGRGREGDDVFLWPDIEPEYRALPGHVLLKFAKEERGFHPFMYKDSGDTCRYLMVLKSSLP